MWAQGFERISVRGFKSFADTTFDMHPLTVLIGPNGAGKSNLLSLLRLLRALSRGELEYFVIKAGGANDILRRAEPPTARMQIGADLLTITGKSRYELNCERTDDDNLVIRSESVQRFEPDGTFRGQEIQNRATRESLLSNGGHIGSEHQLFSRIRTFHVSNTGPSSAPRLPGDEGAEELGEEGSNLAAVLHLLEAAFPKVFLRVEACVREAFPDFAGFALRPWAAEPSRIRLRWTQRGVNEPLEAHLLSDGTIRLIALATLLLLPEKLMPPVVAIDEPELGLHPAALNIVAGLLKGASNYSQVIVSTQSPALLDMIESESIVVMERIDGVTECKHLDAALLGEWLQTYSLGQLWEKNVIGGGPFA